MSALCSHCKKRPAIAHTTLEHYCELCSLDVALALLAHTRLSDASIKSLVASGWNIPVTVEPHFSATEIGAELGISAQSVGRLANKHALKVAQFGEWHLTKASNGKQIQTFLYNKKGKAKFLRIMELSHANDQTTQQMGPA